MRSVRLALQLLLEDGWKPPWLYTESQEWGIHDALVHTCENGAFEGYAEAIEALSAAVGRPILDWERDMGRSESDVIDLFESVVA